MSHSPYPVMVYVGDVDDDGVPDFDSESVVVQLRCGCTTDLRYDYGHELQDPRSAAW